MKSLEVQDLELRYLEYGESGPPVVLIHGFGGGPMDFKPMIDRLSPHCRVFVPNAKVFFSHKQPLKFHEQVDVLQNFVDHVLGGPKVDFHLAGISYGASLSLALRSKLRHRVLSHVIINPMPLNPLEKLRSPLLKVILNFYHLPGGLSMFLKTPIGQRTLRGLGAIFNMGLVGQRKLKHFNQRKLSLIEKALKRFVWVVNHEHWDHWAYEIYQRSPCMAFYSTKDNLFSTDDYEAFISRLGPCDVRPVSSKGHRLMYTHGKEISEVYAQHIEKVTAASSGVKPA